VTESFRSSAAHGITSPTNPRSIYNNLHIGLQPISLVMDPIDLNLSPSCTNCLAWSSDGILAIAAGDYTTLLVPRSSIRELVRNPGSSETLPEPFYSVKIRTNQFTYREWPIQDPLSYKNFSLGEEQSTCKVAALGWSPKGLGKHRRCVLGVLTSNCVLSLWEAEGHPRELGSWGRAGMVNDALRGYFETVLGGDEDVDKEDIEELKRKKRRIRAFDWSPVLYGESYDPFQHHGRLRPRYFDPPWRIRDSLEPPEISKDTDDDRKWGIFYLTITNDDNDIVFARVCREVRMADHDATIRVDIISHLHMAPSPRMPQLQLEYWLSNILDTPHHIRRASWGPWNHIHRSRDKTYCSVSLIAFLHGNTLHFCRVNLTEERQVKWSNVGKNVLKLDAEFVRFVHKTIDLSSMVFESTLLWCDNDTDIYSAPKKNSTVEEEEEEEDDDDDMDTTILHYHLAVTSGGSITLISFPSNIYRHSHELGGRCNFCRMEDNTPVEPRRLDITQQDLTGKQSGHGNFQKVLWEQAIGLTSGPLSSIQLIGNRHRFYERPL
jgi:Transcription factor IIIC subunit delta N-term